MVTIKAEPESVGMSSERLARIAPVMESYVNERRRGRHLDPRQSTG